MKNNEYHSSGRGIPEKGFTSLESQELPSFFFFFFGLTWNTLSFIGATWKPKKTQYVDRDTDTIFVCLLFKSGKKENS